jgi:hypothetical protein
MSFLSSWTRLLSIHSLIHLLAHSFINSFIQQILSGRPVPDSVEIITCETQFSASALLTTGAGHFQMGAVLQCAGILGLYPFIGHQ